MLSDRKLEVQRPRLRKRGRPAQEVEVPAYQAMHNGQQMGARMLEILMRGVSTRNYQEVIPTLAETVGVFKSAVSRRVVEASEAEVEALLAALRRVEAAGDLHRRAAVRRLHDDGRGGRG